MESSPGQRLQEWREYKGLTLSQASRATGIKVTTLSTAEQPGASNPSFDTLSKMLAAFPDLNPDWLLTGSGPLLRDGRALAPVAAAAAKEATTRPAPLDTVPGQIDFVHKYITRLENDLTAAATREAAQQAHIDELLQMLGKPLGNRLPAAAEPEALYHVERNPLGFPVGTSKPAAETTDCVMRQLIPASESVSVTPSYPALQKAL